MRNMSFALTTDQVRAGTKTVTRRLGWENLKAGDLVRPVLKCMGLKPGQKIQPIRGPVRIVSVRREPLDLMLTNVNYGFEECKREGFGDHPTLRWPSEFVQFFIGSHRPSTPKSIVTRIEFEYTDSPDADGAKHDEPPARN